MISSLDTNWREN